MKRTLGISVLLLLAAACQRQEVPAVQESSFTGVIEQPTTLTKTYMDADRNVLWSEGDAVSIFEGSTLNRKYNVTGGAGTAEGSFTYEAGGGFVSGVELPANIAVYPYSSSLECYLEGDSFRIKGLTLPSTQNYAADSFGEEANPMVAVSSGTDDKALTFKNLMGYIKFKLSGTATVTRLEFCGNSSEVLAGPAEVLASYSSAPSVTMTGSALTLTLDCAGGVRLSEDVTSFILALPPTEFQSGFTLRVYDSEGKYMEKTVSSPVSISRNTMTPFSAVMYAETGTDNVRVAMPASSGWNDDLTEAGFTPDASAGSPVFRNDPNAAFVQVSATDSHVDFSQITAAHDDVIDLEYVFYTGEGGYTGGTEVYHDAAGGEIKVKFTVENGTVLKASLWENGSFGSPQAIVSINNESEGGRLNTIVLDEGNAVARTLLNTGEFRLFLDAEGKLADGTPADIRFGSDRASAAGFFVARYEVPVDVDEESPVCFIDGVDLGDAGSWLRLEDLVNIVDWRGRSFADYPNYWSYYGPFEFYADLDHVTCDMSGMGGVSLPSTLDVAQIDPQGNVTAGRLSAATVDVSSWTPSDYGYLAYMNNGTTLQQAFKMTVPIKVKYGFGYINQKITIPVKPQ